MRLAIAVLAALTASLQGAAAQFDGKGHRMKEPAPTTKPSDRKPAMTPCSEYGAGFYRLDGSDTCVKIGGSVDVGVGGRR